MMFGYAAWWFGGLAVFTIFGSLTWYAFGEAPGWRRVLSVVVAFIVLSLGLGAMSAAQNRMLCVNHITKEREC